MWRQELEREQARRGPGRNKLRTYRTFKRDYGTEPYVKTLLPAAQRGALAKLRCGTAPLRIETGRYEGLPEPQRTCFVCGDLVEDERHVLTVCPLYTDIRTDLINTCEDIIPGFLNWNIDQKFSAFLANEQFVRPCAKACKAILDRRFSFLYTT